MPRDPLNTFGQVVQSAAQNADPNDPLRSMTAQDIAIHDGNGLGDYYSQNYDYRLQEDPQLRKGLQAQAGNAMPKLSYDEMYPSASNNIYKGSYSGSEVGSIPIYAPGELFNFAQFDARKRKFEDIALQQQTAKADFYKQKAPQTKRFAVQGELNDLFSSGQQQWVDNAKEQYGNNWTTALKNDPGYNKWLQSMSTVAQYEDGIVDFTAKIDADIKSGEFVASPELLKAKADFVNGVGSLENPFDPKGHDAGSNLLKMRAVYDLDKSTNEAVDKVVKTITDSYPGISGQGIYDMIVKKTSTGVDLSRVDALADEVYKSKYADGAYFTKEDVRNAIFAKLGPKATTYDSKTQTNQFSDSGSNDIKFEETAISPESQDVNFYSITTDKATKVVTTSGQTFAKPINLNVPNDINAVDPSTGKPITVGANSKINIGKTFNVLVDGSGKVVDHSEIELAHKDPNFDPKKKGWRYETFAAGTVKEGNATVKGMNAEGQEVSQSLPQEQTMWIPVKGIKGGIATFDKEGNVIKGARVDVQQKNADKATQELYNRHSSSSTAVSNPTEAQYNSLPKGAKYTYEGVEYTKE